MSAEDDLAKVETPVGIADGHEASQELVVPPEILNPVTGELVQTNDIEAVARAIELLRLAKGEYDAVINRFTEAVAAESLRVGTRTFIVPGAKLTLSADSEILWDVGLLVRKLRAAGCPEARLTALVKTKVEETIDGTVARQLSGANPKYKEIIQSCQQRVPKRQYVAVKPTHGVSR